MRTLLLSIALGAIAAGYSFLYASPLAPTELAVSDTAQWAGSIESGGGWSTHPFFRVRYQSETQAPAAKLRVQVALDPELTELIWDSGFTPIAPTTNGSLTPALAYAGAALGESVTYFWRAAVQNAEGVASPFSPEAASFTVAGAARPCDLRVTVGSGNEQAQGNPTSIGTANPSFSAEYAGDTSGEFPVATGAEVQVSLTSDFECIVATSDIIQFAPVAAGLRSPLIALGLGIGTQLQPMTPYFWRIRFVVPNGPEDLWSECPASFVHIQPVAGEVSPGGFSRTARHFGLGEQATSDMALADVDGNGTLDAIATSSVHDQGHLLYSSFASATPAPAAVFGAARGGRSLLVTGSFDPDLTGLSGVVIADQFGVLHYKWESGQGLQMVETLEIGGYGEPVAVQAAHVDWNGRLDLVIAYQHHVVMVMAGKTGFSEPQLLCETEPVVTGLLVHDLIEYGTGRGLPQILVLAGGVARLFTTEGVLIGDIDAAGATAVTLVGGPPGSAPQVAFAGPRDIVLGRYVLELGGWIVDTLGPHGVSGTCHKLAARNLNAEAPPELVLQCVGFTVVVGQTVDGFVPLEYVGHAGGPAEVALLTANTDLDDFPDIIIARSTGQHSVFRNESRLGVQIAGSSLTHFGSKDSYAEFEVTLDAAPVGTVTVDCETFEPGRGANGGDDDRLPDSAEFARGQSSPPYMPTSSRLVFTPGQTVATFRVQVLPGYHAPAWTIHARIVSAVGAAVAGSTAVTTVYGVGAGTSAPAAQPGLQREWSLRGEVHTMTVAQGTTYLGGSFDGVEWQAAGMAVLDTSGAVQFQPPQFLAAPDIRAVRADASGNVYIGGRFEIAVPGQPGAVIRNIARIRWNGTLDSAFRPNPHMQGTTFGLVNAIDLDKWGRVYFGGKFDRLDNPPVSNMHFRNLAVVHANGTVPSDANRFGVAQGGGGSNGEVHCMRIGETGIKVGEYCLVVGGNYLGAVWLNNYPVMGLTISNLAAFSINGSPGVYTQIPRAYGGAVNAVEIVPGSYGTSYSNTIVFGGSFSGVYYGTTYYNVWNLAVTNLLGQLPGSSPGSQSSVHALACDSHGRIWAGRSVTPSYGSGTPDALAVYSLNGGLLVRQTFTSGLNNRVLGLVAGNDEVLAVGSFTAAGTTPAGHVAAYSAQAGLFGTLRANLRVSVADTVRGVCATWSPTGACTGYAIAGAFQEVVALRGNLAAIDAQGNLLAWCPGTNGPVLAMTTDGATVYFGGSFTTCGGLPRTGAAAATASGDAMLPNGFNPAVSGATATVRAIAYDGSGALYIGGDFTHVGGTTGSYLRTDVARVNKATGVLQPWAVSLDPIPGRGVYALLHDVTAQRLYIGGDFDGTTTMGRPGILAVSDASGTLVSWDAQLAGPCRVWGIAGTASDIVFVGNFTSAGGQARDGAAGADRVTGAVTTFHPQTAGSFRAIAATAGTVYLGGDFASLSEGGWASFTRRGVAALSPAGLVQAWTADVLGTGLNERVNVLLLEGTTGAARVWVGGRFSGTAHVGQHDLTWFPGSWSITTSSLPPAQSGQPYGPVQIVLSELLPSSWTILAPAAPGLQIDSSGQIYGIVPTLQHWQPPLVAPVQVMADHAGQICSKWFVLTVLPPPPPTVVSVAGPMQVMEGNQPALTPAPVWTLTLNQAFGADVVVHIDYVDGLARRGYEYAPLTTQVIIPAGHYTAQFPVTIFGNTQQDVAFRDFTLVLTSATASVQVTNPQYPVLIEDDDFAIPRPAFVRWLQVRESGTTPADPSGVVADQPFLAWSFGSDFVGEVQARYQVQLSHDPAFSSLVWDFTSAAPDASNVVQVGAPVPMGQDCYARVRVWPTAPGSPSEWRTISYHRNWAPPAATPIEPVSTVHSARPVLRWSQAGDADGDALHFVIRVHESGGSTLHQLDSRTAPDLFEVQTPSGWQPMTAGGLAPAAGVTTEVRLRTPASWALASQPVSWVWTVTTIDPYEAVNSSSGPSFDIDPMYEIAGAYHDPNGVVGNRTVHAVAQGGPILATATTDPATGGFRLFIPVALTASDVIAVFVDPASGSHAAALLRFPGSDLVDPSGTFGRVSLHAGKAVIDARGMPALTLADLMAIPHQPGLPLVATPPANDLVLLPTFTTLELRADVQVRGAAALPGEATVLRLADPGQKLLIHPGAALTLSEGGTADTMELDNQGSLTVGPNSVLALNGPAGSSGRLWAASGASVLLNAANLDVDGGMIDIGAATVSGGGLYGVVTRRADLRIAASSFQDAFLDIGADLTGLNIDGLSFVGGASGYCIRWGYRAVPLARLNSVTFDSVTGFNVTALPAAARVELVGCAGDHAGEAFDDDPGEAAGADLVVWLAAEIAELGAYAGDSRVLLTWNAGAQTGAGFQYEILVAAQYAGPYTQLGTTGAQFYVHDPATNDVEQFYKVRPLAWGNAGADSEIVAATPRAPEVAGASPTMVDSDGIWPAVVFGNYTHFGASTVVNTATSGMTVPASSILALSSELLLFDIETQTVALGAASLEIVTPDVWFEHGFATYQELLPVGVQVVAPPSPNYPKVSFVQTGGAVEENDITDGAFLVAVEFDSQGGADIDPDTFECVVDRDFYVGGSTLIQAGENIAGSQYALWGTPATTGATWSVEQILVTTDMQEEWIASGELVIRVRVANEYGFWTQWHFLRIYIGGSGLAIISGDLVQGQANQTLYVNGESLNGADWIEFSDAEITVTDVNVLQGGGSSYGSGARFFDDGTPDLSALNQPVVLEIKVDVGLNANVGKGTFDVVVQGNPPTVVSTGSYWLVRDQSVPAGMPASYPFPMANAAAVNVTLQNGEFTWRTVDASTKGRAFPIVFDRTYRSSKVGINGPLGRGWSGTYLQYLIVRYDTGAHPTPHFDWYTPNGDKISFVASWDSPASRWKFATPVGVAASAWHKDVAVTQGEKLTQEITIQTAAGLRFTFGGPEVRARLKNLDCMLPLVRVADANNNEHTLEYTKLGWFFPTFQLDYINGDAFSASGHPYSGECLRLVYHSNGKIAEVQRVARLRTPPFGPQVLGTFESVKYWYSADHDLTLQQLPAGHRWSQLAQNPTELWNGYIYQNGLLTSVLSPSQCAPSFGAELWEGAAGLVSGQEADVVNTYTQQDGPHGAEQRVTSQQLPGVRTLAIAYQNNPTSHVVEKATVMQPDNSTLEHALNVFGQADQVTLSDGVNSYVTEYEYHQDTRATVRTTYPGDSSVFLLYAHSEQPISAGVFTVLTGTTPPLNQSWVLLAGITDLQLHARKLIKLRRPDGFCRYVIVEPASAGQHLLVYGDLAAEGWTSGAWEMYDSNTNPLSRYKVIQERRTEGRGWTAHDLVTTYAHEDTMRYGNYFPNTPMTVDSRGNMTRIVTQPAPKYLPPGQRTETTTDTETTYTQIRWSGGARKRTVTTRSISDCYGRRKLERGPRIDADGRRETSTYAYWDQHAHNGHCGQPNLVTTVDESGTQDGGGSAKTATTRYYYDQFGNLALVRSPRGDGQANPNYRSDTHYKYNAAGQLVHVKHPPAGAPGSAASPETYYFYDKNGRVTSEISYLSSTHSGTSSGSSLPADAWNIADGALQTTFDRPSTRRDRGWLHTMYTYNARGEVTSITTDVDAGPITATTHYEYDVMGRLTRQTDPNALVTEYEYDVRGLIKSVTIAAGDASLEATTTYEYDIAGNVTREWSPLGTLVSHEYDGFGRRTRSVSPAAGGVLVNEVTYPKPTEPNVLKQVWQGVTNPYHAPLGPARMQRSHQDEFGNTNKQWQLARDHTGAPLAAAVTQDGYPWAETCTELTPRGEVLKSWATVAGGQYNSATLLADVAINGFGWLVRDNLAYSASTNIGTDFSHDAEGNVTKTDYNYIVWNGDLPQRQAANSRTEYDPAGNAWKNYDHFGAATEYLCNNLGWVETVIGADGRHTETEYDFAGRPTKHCVKQGSQEIHITHTEYDISGQPTSQSAGPTGIEQQTLYVHDKRGRLTKRSLPAGGEWVYEYDLEDRQVRVKQPDGKFVHNRYDSAGNLVLRVVTQGTALDLGTLSTGQQPSAEAIEIFEFNEFGEITSAESKGSSGVRQNLLTFEYNTLGAIERQELTVFEGGQPVSVDVNPHYHNSTELGFESLYELNPFTFSNWSMESIYNAHGVSTELHFWDSRTLRFSNTGPEFQPIAVQDPLLKDGTELLRYNFAGRDLAYRQFGEWSKGGAIRVASPRPGIPGKSSNVGSGWHMANSVTRFTQDERQGTSEVRHLHKWPQSLQQVRTFSAVETRRDRGGNPVFERRVDRGGLSRLFAYDLAGRMTAAISGHHLPAGCALPSTDLPNDSSYVAGASTLQHQWRRAYQQDSVDNITGFDDYLSGSLSANTTITINSDKRNVIESRDDLSGQFSYETSGRITGDPTTGLSYEHNWRGQIVRVLNGSTIIRRMDYDCFGRMVHQVDAPGTTHERGTIFVPNIGFGGDGAGADTAAEVTWKSVFGQRVAQEIVQFTYGLGAVTGGIGWKRLVEFVAYCGEFAPYYRFLHEDAQGNTIATTSLYGDRLDDYDYTEYGVPVHAPVALDGRWISSIAAHGTYQDVSVVTLRGDVLSDLELLGCELRVARPALQGADVFATGIVISHNGTVVWVRDLGGECASAWAGSSDEAKAIAAFYDLRAGMRHGVMKAVSSGVVNVPMSPHHGDPCLEIEVEHDPFESWMVFQPFGTPKSVAIRIGPGKVPGTLVTATADRLIVVGAFTAQDYGPGKWFTIDGSERKPEAIQTGTWHASASTPGQTNGSTIFTLDPYAAVTPFMVGWVLQPDVNRQVFAPIMGVSGNTVSVRGDYAALGQAGTSFRICAPPGIERRGAHAGTLNRWVAAESSRCLYASYRYESPLAGFEAGTSTHPQADCRQTGPNFGGLHYTLFRHYDPVQMRFTGPDPAASPFHNLHAYCGNNPAGAYDPDGLWPEGRPSNHTNFDMGGPGGGSGAAGGGMGGFGFGGLSPGFGGPGIGNATMEFHNVGAGMSGGPGRPAVERVIQSFERSVERDKVLAHQSTYSEWERGYFFFLFTIADCLPSGAGAEAISGTDSVYLTPLTTEQIRAKAIQATVETALITIPAIAPRGARWGWNKVKGWRAPSVAPPTSHRTIVFAPPTRLPATKTIGAPGTYSPVRIKSGCVYTPLASKGGAGPLRWTRTNPHVSSLHNQPATFYMLVNKDTGAVLKWGITKNPSTRYSQKWLKRNSAEMLTIAEGSRADMLRLERQHVGAIPGRMNRERYAGSYWGD